MASLSVLQQLCASHCCELWISSHQNVAGQVETTVHIPRKLDTASASIARVAAQHSASTGVVVLVNRQPISTTKEALLRPWNSRV